MCMCIICKFLSIFEKKKKSTIKNGDLVMGGLDFSVQRVLCINGPIDELQTRSGQ